MFKRSIILASSFIVIASSVAVAQPRYHGPGSNSYYVEKKVIHVPARGHVRQKEVRHHRWAKGQRMNDWRRHSQVRDYHRHGLRTPGRGQTWVKVDNNYLLLSMATGLVAAVTAAR
ncbi:MAG TPA: RcnB family protein [Bosea sp. (in: a-proteobacteria)]|jgi:Ni/Co efflux regulator RcnB|uniref:RcnB family protein n=1 Tax=Bosea sp. (in: a-proteobacteria) TaxID=1871050 RepID=UPI002E0E2AFF|nr:RcnB family protein [Bosea sp. (in: a-proteobacteria)]